MMAKGQVTRAELEEIKKEIDHLRALVLAIILGGLPASSASSVPKLAELRFLRQGGKTLPLPL